MALRFHHLQNGRPKFFVLTGGPGAGKTSVIEALAARGETTTVEAGRAVIATHAEQGHAPPWIDPLHFADLMLAHDMAEYRRAGSAPTARVFFDRGIPDLIGYLRLMGRAVPDHIREAARSHRYVATVFVFPPWRDIYTQDEERHQDFAEAVRTSRHMTTAYDELGYALVEVPRLSVERRADFLLDHITT